MVPGPPTETSVPPWGGTVPGLLGLWGHSFESAQRSSQNRGLAATGRKGERLRSHWTGELPSGHRWPAGVAPATGPAWR